MPSYMPGYLIKEVRLRKKWQQAMLIDKGFHADSTLSRIESDKEKPYGDTLRSLMEGLEIPTTQFIYPYLEQTMDAFILRDRLLNCLDSMEDNMEAYLLAEGLLERFENMQGFTSGINLQFVLSCKARLWEKQGAEPLKTIALIREGIALTFPEFDEESFEGELLIFEEAELLHTLARVYARDGNLHGAVMLLYDIQKGLNKLPEEDRVKEKKLASILLSLSQFLIELSEYSQALEICEFGNNVSIKNAKGKYTPDFLYNKAVCLFHLGRAGECPDILRQAYFGYTMLHKRRQSERVLRNAGSIFGVTIETYGTDRIEYNYPVPFSHFERGERTSCKNIGELIGMFRVWAGMTQKELCQGICSTANFSKIENGEIQPNVYYLEAFIQRLGRDINLYANTFLSVQEFEEKWIRDEISYLLAARRYKEAEVLIGQLENKKAFISGVNLQFIMNAKATMVSVVEGDKSQNYLSILNEALKITLPDFDEKKIAQYRLTYYEITLINKIALYYAANGEIPRCVKIFEKLVESINNSYVDEFEKVRTYIMILYNYSKYLGNMKRYEEELEIASEGESLALKHGRLTDIPRFAVNKACAFLELGRKEESVPFFAQAYYGSVMFNRPVNRKITGDFVKERLGIVIA